MSNDSDREFPCAIERHKYRGKLMDENPVCFYCGEPVTWKRSTLDHVMPVARGGKDSISNVVLCCRPCNNAKADRTLDEWISDLVEARKRLECDEEDAATEKSLMDLAETLEIRQYTQRKDACDSCNGFGIVWETKYRSIVASKCKKCSGSGVFRSTSRVDGVQ